MKHILFALIAPFTFLSLSVIAAPLHDAAENGNLSGVQTELNKGVDVNLKVDWDKRTPLHFAASKGHKDITELLITQSANVNAKDKYGWTPLHLAAYYGHKEIAKVLINNGADVNSKRDGGKTPLDSAIYRKQTETANLLREYGGMTGEKLKLGMTPMHIAAKEGQIKIIKLFLVKGADVNVKTDDESTPLHLSARSGHMEITKILVNEGANVRARDISGSTPLHNAASGDHKGIAELLITKGANVNVKSKWGDTPLDLAGSEEIIALLHEYGGKYSTINQAIFRGNTESVKEFLADGADVNSKIFTMSGEYTLLQWVAVVGHIEIAILLIDNGADLQARTHDLPWGQPSGGTPLYLAAQYGHKEILELLISRGADMNVKDDWGATPLHLTTSKEIAEILINKEADVNAKDGRGSTPLHNAASRNHKEIAELLITKGANVDATDDRGWTPLHEAAYSGRKEVSELLIVEGADVNAKSKAGHMQVPMTPLDKTYEEPWDSDETKAAKKEIAELLHKHGGKTAGELKALMPRLVQHSRFAFSFGTKEGMTYQVQDSLNLTNWEVIKTYTGTGSSARFDEERDHDPPQIFYRIKVIE